LHLLHTPLATHLQRGIEKKFNGRIWKDDCANIAPFHDHVCLTTQVP
jgi:hypothetical protein